MTIKPTVAAIASLYPFPSIDSTTAPAAGNTNSGYGVSGLKMAVMSRNTDTSTGAALAASFIPAVYLRPKQWQIGDAAAPL
ncbi:MAG: hypothetical protein ACPG1A_16145 [Halioglobus sp.]